MHLRLKNIDGSRKKIEVNKDWNFKQFYEAIQGEIGSFDGGFFVSLNGSEPLTPRNEEETVSELLRNGDLIWIVGVGGSSSAVPLPTSSTSSLSAESTSSAMTPSSSKVPRSAETQASSSQAKASGSSDDDSKKEDGRMMQAMENQWNQAEPRDPVERLIIVLENLMTRRGFKNDLVEIGSGLAKWREKEEVRLSYKHQESDTSPKILIRKPGRNHVEVTSFCEKGDTHHSQRRIYARTELSNLEDSIERWMDTAVQEMKWRIVRPLCTYAIGSDIPMLKILTHMPDWAECVMMWLDVGSLCRLEKSCWEMEPFTRKEKVWKHFIQRDFSSDWKRLFAAGEKKGVSYRDVYIEEFLKRKREREREILMDVDVGLRRPLPHHRDPQWIPQPNYPNPHIIQDPDPLGIFPRPRIPNPFPNIMDPGQDGYDPMNPLLPFRPDTRHGPRFNQPKYFPGNPKFPF